jgi:hypothetical protein
MQQILSAFPAILKYGTTGLCALLFFFAFLLLRQYTQKERKPDQETLKTIRTYIYIAFALAVVSLVSTTIDAFKSTSQKYRVVGTIQKEDGEIANDVNIYCRFPLHYPSREGELIGLKVWRDPDGNLPELAFAHRDYLPEPIDLNDSKKVRLSDGKAVILSPVILKEDPKK